jgi:hypothetical protein
MSNRVFVIVSSADREVVLEPGFLYPLNAKKKKWMDEVKVIIFGPAEKLVASDVKLQEKVKKLLAEGIEVMACKWCSDHWQISDQLEEIGIKVEYVGSVMSQLLQDGWASLTF